MPLRTSDNNFGTAKWIVSANYSDGCTHTTIASALASASSGDTIFIRTGTYTENLTLVAGVNLSAFGSDSGLNESAGTVSNVIIVGKLTFTAAGTVTIYGIQLRTNSDFFLAVTGSAASLVNLVDCYLNVLNNNGISFTSSSSSSRINIFSCTGNIGTTGITPWVCTANGALLVENSEFENSGASTTPSTCNPTSLNVNYCLFKFPLSMTASALTMNFSQINVANTTSVTTATSGSSVIIQSYFQSGTASALSIGASTTVSIYQSSISSTNTNAITGAGTINFDCLSFSNTSSTINTTTQTVRGTIAGLKSGANPTAGYMGESVSSAVGLTTVTTSATQQNLTSISLTAGVWDVSGSVYFQSGGVAGSVYNVGVNTTSANLGTLGDNYYACAFSALNMSLASPQKRFTLSSTTTVFLVVMVTFSSTMSGAGRISATRVG